MSVTVTPDPITVGIATSMISGAFIIYVFLFAKHLPNIYDIYQKHSIFRKEVRDTVEKMFWDIQGNCGDSIKNLKNSASCFRRDILQLKDLVMAHPDYLKSKEFVELIRLLNTVKVETEDEIEEKGILGEGYYRKVLVRFREIVWLKISVKELNFEFKRSHPHTHRKDPPDAWGVLVVVLISSTIPVVFWWLFNTVRYYAMFT